MELPDDPYCLVSGADLVAFKSVNEVSGSKATSHCHAAGVLASDITTFAKKFQAPHKQNYLTFQILPVRLPL